MKIFLSCVSSEFKSYRLKLANHLGAVKGGSIEIKVQEDFQQGGFTLLDQLADYVRDCDAVIHLVGEACGARPGKEHVRAFLAPKGQAAGLPAADPGQQWSYTQWEYQLAMRFNKRVLVYVAKPNAPRDCGLPVPQSDDEAQLQQAHWNQILASGKNYKPFSSPAGLVREVFYDLGLNPRS